MPAPTTLSTGWSFLEDPRWHDGRWWVSDFYTHKVLAITEAGEVSEIVEVEGQPSGLGWLPDGDLLIASMRDRLVLRLHDGQLTTHADLRGFAGGHLNDMLVDPAGRAYVGNFGFDLMGGGMPATADLARIDPDGTVTIAAADLAFPNGMALGDAGRTLIVAETMAPALTAFDVADDGTLTNRRSWAALTEIGPDGIALDAEGCVWAADAYGKRAVRLGEGGEILDEVTAGDDLAIYACALGGADGRTLFLCCAPNYFESERSGTREGVAKTVRVDVGAPSAS